MLVLLVVACVAFLVALRVGAWLVLRRLSSDPSSGAEPVEAADDLRKTIVVRPYLQLGDRPGLMEREALELFWHTTAEAAHAHGWQVQLRAAGEKNWRAPLNAAASDFKLETGLIAVQDWRAEGPDPKIKPPEPVNHARFNVVLRDLPAGAKFEYRLLVDGAVAFHAQGITRCSAEQPYTFAVVGDLGEARNHRESKVAHRIGLNEPDFLVVTGDIAYQRGRVCEYLVDFLSVYNSQEVSPGSGGRVLCSAVSFGLVGNHDVCMPHVEDRADFSVYPDILAYYMFFQHPSNGPTVAQLGTNVLQLHGDADAISVFKKLAGDRFPRMGMYSFNWGNSHWVVLDANCYMDWTSGPLREWLEKDLRAAGDAVWKFVCFHQPPFVSDRNHENEQRMRVLAPLFEATGVDVVFSGHNHCYERTYPLRFKPNDVVPPVDTDDCPVDGELQVDTVYDGKENVRPNGVIYVVDGAGGAKFYPWRKPEKGQYKRFTVLHDQSAPSFSLCRVEGKVLTIRQLSGSGEEIDSYVIDKR